MYFNRFCINFGFFFLEKYCVVLKHSQSFGAVATGAANGREIFGNASAIYSCFLPHRMPSFLPFSPSVSLLKMLLETLRNNTFWRQLQKRATRKELEEQSERPKQTKTKENFALPIAYLSALRGTGRNGSSRAGVHCSSARLTGETVGAVTATAAAFNSRHPWRLPAY